MATILIVDDNRAVCTALEVLFALHGLKTRSAASPDEALSVIDAEDIDLVIQDMNFRSDTTSGEDGIKLFRDIRDVEPEMPVILLTGWTHLEHAVDLMRAGAADYLGKPWDDAKLITTVHNLLRLRQATRENHRLRSARRAVRTRVAGQFDLCGLVYESDAMHEIVTLATRVAHADVPVLITGPNGAGKEKIAEIVQANSSVSDGPFIRVNVGALPAELMSAELFGAEAGAFTGAQKARVGRFEAADGGTLFLDEIGTLSLEGQVKLLRVLQTGQFERLGSTQTRSVKVRLISATNSDLQAAISAGTFREDLYYRLNVIELRVPALRDRADDILVTANAFLDANHRFSLEAERALLAYPWPGNVRELQNCVKRACLLAAGDVIQPRELGLPAVSDRMAESAATHALPEPDRDTVQAVLARSGGVIASAARELGLSRQALYRRMEKFGLHKPE
ncbi:DNA-binding transcriptional response regulator, NtrC family, contains REC, AAA-type ATPase, and a Fis-type DNA-binding domains [Hydrocarboniphaga daqingensis]|jgi:DNA-binding NtrC family response regulator|uniref:DNA-binding transcriptional response regulator, NtrC family, contains REC, AAA-type ATPase, and a Fis-type DNA-binding domains n=1 Tax=Hydrocarboniphaga daqingensis TaxID=490188 RepID=A0A1M5MTI4_9GAMM|nr:sigma-54 dependent transcriptional regulator [Hydrocarboniphaga daqingensis]SHG80452.1 DNA-binding transcriptional response regulator, NtrC family, contains REC, AAA-type ATPase, and a Fis-type DNA-binding domains [Hydrocarboniphaga daqingensis]